MGIHTVIDDRDDYLPDIDRRFILTLPLKVNTFSGRFHTGAFLPDISVFRQSYALYAGSRFQYFRLDIIFRCFDALAAGLFLALYFSGQTSFKDAELPLGARLDMRYASLSYIIFAFYARRYARGARAQLSSFLLLLWYLYTAGLWADIQQLFLCRFCFYFVLRPSSLPLLLGKSKLSTLSTCLAIRFQASDFFANAQEIVLVSLFGYIRAGFAAFSI